MILGVLVMLLAALNVIPVFLSQLLEWSIYYLNKIINAIASLEQFIIQDIPLQAQYVKRSLAEISIDILKQLVRA